MCIFSTLIPIAIGDSNNYNHVQRPMKASHVTKVYVYSPLAGFNSALEFSSIIIV